MNHPTATVRPHNGRPTLFINGRPDPALAYMTFNMQDKPLRQFADAGVRLFTFSTNCDYDYYRFSKDAWPEPGRFDYSQFDQRMEMILRACPDALIFPRVYICSPAWWDRQHPDQLMRGKDGILDPQPNFGWLPQHVKESFLEPAKMTVPSFASQQWRADSGEALRRFVEYSERTWGQHTIGYHLVSGGSQEWYYWGSFDHAFADYSEPQQQAFRKWLAARGWPDADTISIPDAATRAKSELGIFRDPSDPAARLAIAYWQFHSEVLVEAMSHFAAVTRGAIGPDKLIGVFYGYFVDLQRHATCWPNSGHLALRKFLADPNINFVSSPTAYKNRAPVAGFSIFNSLTESMALHGKLWWNENDILTPQSPPLKDKLFYVPKDAAESTHLQRREFANALCHGVGQWWFDMWAGCYDDPATMRDIRRMIEIGRRSMDLDRSSVAEIAVVLDDESVYHLEASNRLTVPLIADQLIELGHIGAPFDVLHPDDLPAAKPYRLYVFLDLFHATAERRHRIRSLLRSTAATALYVYAPGLIEQDISPQHMARLTGLPLLLDRSPEPLRVSTTWGEYGIDEPIAPVIYAEAAHVEVEVLGTLTSSRRPGLVRRKLGHSTAVFSAAPRLPAGHLRQLARDAGVHIYCDGGQAVYANASFLAVCGAPGEPLALRLPRAGRLHDLFEDREVEASPEAVLPPSADGVRVFLRGQ